MIPLSAEQLVLATLIVTFAAAVQASVGFGLALIAAPLLLFIDRLLVPGPLLWSALLLSVLAGHRERHAIDKSGFVWGFGGRVLGTIPAVLALQSLSPRDFELYFALLVMLGVGISLVHPNLRPTPGSLFAAGTLSGLMGTISSIGGPPMALVYQNSRGPELRATLSVYFVVGSTISILLLSLGGLFGVRELLLSLVLSPGVVLGFWLSRFTLGWMSRAVTRPLILGLSFASATGLLLRWV